MGGAEARPCGKEERGPAATDDAKAIPSTKLVGRYFELGGHGRLQACLVDGLSAA